MNTKMWAHRILKKIPRFDHSSPIDFGDKYEYGEYIGIYHNTLARKNIYFFEKGFMFSDKKDDFKKYEEIHKKYP